MQGLDWGDDPSKDREKWGSETKKGKKPIKGVSTDRLPL